MFNQLKSFLSRTFSKQPEISEPARAKEAPKAAPAKAAPAPAATPKAAVAAAKAPAPVAAGGAPATPDEIFNLPVKVVISQFSPALNALVKSPGNADLALPLKRILSQLPQGAVKLTFEEIRHAAPAGTFLDVTSQDQTVVDLPLPEILSRLSPAHLSRRPAQKTLEVPADVGNVFGPRGEQLQQANAAKAAAAASAAAPAVEKPAMPAAPKVAAPPAPKLPKIAEPAAKVPAPNLPPPPVKKPEPTAPIKIPAPGLPKVEPVAAKPVGDMPDIPQNQTQFFLNKETAAVGEVLTVPLGSLSDSWPQNIKEEISSSKLRDSSVALPMERIEAGLKTGKLSFAWSEIAGWLKPNPHTSQLNADTTVDLPLKIVAPLFIAQHRPVKSQKKLAIDETIPDVFAGGKGGLAAAPAMPAPPPAAPKPSLPVPPPAAPKAPEVTPAASLPKPSVAAPSAPALPKPAIPAPSLPKPSIPAPSLPKLPIPQPPKSAPAPAPAAAKEAESLGELFGDPSKKVWSPKEIVQKANTLKGISGSIVVLQDGLMVAGELAAPFRAETTAAFLPQIFGRMTQYAKELNLGDMSTLVFECEKAPIQVTKAGLVYFGVIGKPGESLPVGQIKMIAAELAKQNN